MKKNIMILVTKLSNGGAEKATTILAKNLSEKYNVYLTVFDNSIQDYETNLKIIDLQTKITKNLIKKIFNFFKRINLLKNLKQKYNIDCTISFLTVPNLINVLTKRKDKTIISIRNNIKQKRKLENIINKHTMKYADKIVTVSKDMENYYIKKEKIDSNKIITINNVCDIEEIRKKSKEKIDKYNEIFESRKIIISLGRYIEQKGQWHLIKAFSKISQEYNDYKLVIFGRGKEKEKLQKLIDYLNLNENVFLLDFVSNPYKYLEKSEIFVISSLFEGFSNAILEAMAIGLPIIATDCDYGNREILAPRLRGTKIKKYQEQEYGILVPINSCKKYELKKDLTNEENELYKAIKKLIQDKKLKEYYKQKSLERIKDFETNTNKWINCIEED